MSWLLGALGPAGLLIKIVASFFTGGGLTGVVQAVTQHLDKLNDNETKKFETAVGADKEVVIAQMQANTTVYHDRVGLLKGLWITQYLIAAALVPPLYHQAMVYFDSTPFFYFTFTWQGIALDMHVVGSWKVPAAPGVYAEREGVMIGSLLGIQGLTASALGALKFLRR